MAILGVGTAPERALSFSEADMRKLLRVLFSRYFVSFIIILFDIAVLGLIGFRLYEYSVYFIVALGVIDILTLVAVINDDCNPEYKVTWIAIVLLLTGFGSLLYILFRKRRMSKKNAKRMESLNKKIAENSYSDEAFSSLGKEDSAAAGKAMAILSLDPTAEVYGGTSSRFYPAAENMFRDMLVDMSRAKKYIFLEYFIIEEGFMWGEIHKILKEKAEDGVDVRVMYDDIGCMSKLRRNFKSNLEKEGIKVCCFSPVSPRLSAEHNNRDHRKICVIDGVYAYTGGVNLADEYINRVERFGHWKDGGIRLEGEAAEGLLKLFLLGWGIMKGEEEDYSVFFEKVDTPTADGGYYIPFGSGPKPVYKGQVGKRAILDIVNQATSYVYITTPYLIIDYDLSEALRGASVRGVDVRIITPKIPDKKMIKVLTKSAYPSLIEAGVSIYEYTPGFIHEKTLVADGRYAIIGTINMDYRSLVHHYEDAVWIYNSPAVTNATRAFLDTVERSERIEGEGARLGLIARAVRNLIRLFAPLL